MGGERERERAVSYSGVMITRLDREFVFAVIIEDEDSKYASYRPKPGSDLVCAPSKALNLLDLLVAVQHHHCACAGRFLDTYG